MTSDGEESVDTLWRRLEEVGRSLHSDGGGYRELALDLVAPVATGFACWVLDRARQQGLSRLYFLSRDCRLILEAARLLAPQFGGIDCRSLQVSRQALFLPSSTGLNEEGMPWLFENTDRHGLDTLLPKLELSTRDFAAVNPFPGMPEEVVIRTDAERAAFWRALNESPLHEPLRRTIEHRREAARRYFQAQGLLDPVPCGIVDIGWLLRCQRALNTLLVAWGRPAVPGFYLGIRPGREEPDRAGPAESLFVEPDAPKDGGMTRAAVFKQVLLIENIFCTADHPTVHRYECGPGGEASVQYRKALSPEEVRRYGALEKMVSDYAARCAGFATQMAPSEVAAPLLDKRIRRFLENPSAAAVRPLAKLEISFFQNDLDPVPAVRPLTWREAIAPSVSHRVFLRKFFQHPRVLWYKGSVAISRGPVRALYAACVRLRNVERRLCRPGGRAERKTGM